MVVSNGVVTGSAVVVVPATVVATSSVDVYGAGVGHEAREPVGTVPPPQAQHAMLASTPFFAKVSKMIPRMGVHPSPWHPSGVHQLRLEYKLQSSPSASSQAWLANLPPRSAHDSVIVCVVFVDVVG